MTAEDLKKSILQEAIQGKLAPQIASEGTGKELLEKILKEKAELIKKGKLKKEKPLEPINDDEIPFDIPESWCWCRIADLGNIVTGNTPSKNSPEYYGDIYPFYKPMDLNQGINVIEAHDYLSNIGFEKARQLPINSVLVTCIGATIGKTGLIRKQGACNQQINAIIPHKVINPEYIYYVMASNYMQENIRGKSSSTTLPIINKNIFSSLIFPLPPLTEQHRIVDAIEKFMPLIEEYGKREIKLNSLNEVIGEKTKKAILQEAISGVLTEGWRKNNKVSETGKDLLEKLVQKKHELASQNKIMKKKPTVPFYDSEQLSNFNLPETWEWVQLSDVSLIQEGAGIRKWQYTNEGIQILCVTNILDGKVDLEKKLLFISEKEYKEKYMHLTLNKGDIVTSCSGGSWGKISFFNKDQIVMLNTSTLRMRFWDDLADNNYLYYICQSSFFKNQLLDQLSGMQPNFGYAHYSRIMFPLPPLAEQKQIVKTIEALLPLCDKLGK